MAAFLGKDVYTNYKEFTSAQSSPAIHFIDPKPNTHDALQNVLLMNQTANLAELNFNLCYTSKKTSFNLPKDYIVIQASSANNKAPYKNWDFEKWLALFKHLQSKSPNTTLVLLGDDTELYLNEKINLSNHPNVLSLIGKTTLNDVMEIIHHSQFYIGFYLLNCSINLFARKIGNIELNFISCINNKTIRLFVLYKINNVFNIVNGFKVIKP